MITIHPIVEGHGEQHAMRVLITRVANWLGCEEHVNVPQPFRQPRSSLVKKEGLQRAVEAVARRITDIHKEGILVMVDADKDCPVELARTMARYAQEVRPQLRVAVVIPNKEYEAWFLASASSLQSKMKPGVEDHPKPDQVKDAKGWLADHLASRVYSETVDQVALTALFNLELAQKSRSFQKLTKEMAWLCHLPSPH